MLQTPTLRPTPAGRIDSASVAQLLVAWQHTAEVHSDTELPAALAKDHAEDYGPVPDPRDVP